MSLKLRTDQQIIENLDYRWPRICINPDVWNEPRNLLWSSLGPWTEIKFDKANVPLMAHLKGQQGIYMFIAKPHNQYNSNHSFILYVGETGDLEDRFKQYFAYARAKKVGDQLKRRMVLVWEGHLYFQYITTNFASTREREVLEYDIIDSIAPLINDKFKSEAIKGQMKELKNF